MSNHTFWMIEDDPEESGDDPMELAAEYFVRSDADSVTVVEYRRNTPTEEDVINYASDVLDLLIERITDDKGLGLNDDAGYPEPTFYQIDLARMFVRQFLTTWTPHWGTPTGKTMTIQHIDDR